MAIKRRIAKIGEALAMLEFLAFCLAAFALVLLGPAAWLYRLFAAREFVAATGVGLLWALSATVVAWETRKNGIRVTSFIIFVTWLVVLIYVFRDWIT